MRAASTGRSIGGISPLPVTISAAALLLLGASADLGFTRREAESYAQEMETKRAHDRLAQTEESRSRQARVVAEYLGDENLESALDSLSGEEAVTFLDRALRDAGLRRRELATHETSKVGRLQRTEFFIGAAGRFHQVHAFLRQLEEGPRTVVVERVLMLPIPGSEDVEVRIDLATYDPS